MAYISNKERARKASELKKGFGWQKFIIATAAILSAAVLVFILLMLVLPELGVNVADNATLITNTDGSLNAWGWVVVGASAAIFLFDILAFILVFTMKPPKKTIETVKELAATPLSGKKGSSKVVLEKVEASTLTKSKKPAKK